MHFLLFEKTSPYGVRLLLLGTVEMINNRCFCCIQFRL
nr:MAG TPA: hypothetical protein [Caudoviricetes sp.]